MADDFACLLECIRRMDDAWLEIVSSRDDKKRQHVSERPMSPELFDKLF